MTFTKEQLQAVMTGTDINHCVEVLRQLLGYPVKEHDPQGSRFWYLRPGVDELEAEETCPIAVGFYEELSGVTRWVIHQSKIECDRPYFPADFVQII